ncbi:ABC transporter permease [Christensenellaceae bacterium OttesenSCG-928-L17]|nr:ABC transporter permease [Christensenellaceae bacterium OttesenSCG-928-L17]
MKINLIENMRVAWEGLRANKMRSILTMLGIIIGIGSVIAILTVGNGLSGSINSSMSVLGANNIAVSLQYQSTNSGYVVMEEDDLITDDMLDAMLARFGGAIEGVALEEGMGSGKAQDGRKYANLSLSGVSEDYLMVNNITLQQGRNIMERDLDGARNVAIVSDKLVEKLFAGNARAALGEEIKVTVNGQIYAFNIVGVYKYEQSMMNMSFAAEEDLSTAVYIPITTAKRLGNGMDGYTYFTVMANDTVDSKAFATQLSDFFNRYYEKNENFGCYAMSMESITDQVNEMMSTVSIALSIIAGISLLVGGIGVMNIMLVSVTERTREIGTRKALGATNGNIRLQFVVESIIICAVGGVIGVLFGGLLGYLGSSLLSAASGPSIGSILLAVGFSMAIGIFFGYYPANKAAKLDPIEALRYE